jgi:uncharacterized protein (UPF0276 family)
VWRLLDRTYTHLGTPPTLLERDFNLPPLGDLLDEVRHISTLQGLHREKPHERVA